MNLQFQKVWNQQLSNLEKQQYIQFAQKLILSDDKLTTTSYLIKSKKDGGINATVFIHNGTTQPIHLQNIIAVLLNECGEQAASHHFDVSLTIDAKTMMPWSFVFPKETIDVSSAPNNQWQLSIKL